MRTYFHSFFKIGNKMNDVLLKSKKGVNGDLTTQFFDKRDDFEFSMVNFPY